MLIIFEDDKDEVFMWKKSCLSAPAGPRMVAPRAPRPAPTRPPFKASLPVKNLSNKEFASERVPKGTLCLSPRNREGTPETTKWIQMTIRLMLSPQSWFAQRQECPSRQQSDGRSSCCHHSFQLKQMEMSEKGKEVQKRMCCWRGGG